MLNNIVSGTDTVKSRIKELNGDICYLNRNHVFRTIALYKVTQKQCRQLHIRFLFPFLNLNMLLFAIFKLYHFLRIL